MPRPSRHIRAIKRNDFMCVCGKKGKKDAEDIYREVLRRLKTTPEKFLTAAVYSLHWDLDAWYKGIGCDQWCGVSAEGMAKGVLSTPAVLDDDDPAKITSYIQCDVVEHGIAATWLYFAQQKDAELAKKFSRKGYFRKGHGPRVSAKFITKQYHLEVYDAARAKFGSFRPGVTDQEQNERKEFHAECAKKFFEKYNITAAQVSDAETYSYFYR